MKTAPPAHEARDSSSDNAAMGMNRRAFMTQLPLALASFSAAYGGAAAVSGGEMPRIISNSMKLGVQGKFKTMGLEEFYKAGVGPNENLIPLDRFNERVWYVTLSSLGDGTFLETIPKDLLGFLQKETARLQMGTGNPSLDIARLLVFSSQLAGPDGLWHPLADSKLENDKIVTITSRTIRAIQSLGIAGKGDKAVFDVSNVPLLSGSGQTKLKISAYASGGITSGIQEYDKESSRRVANALMKIRGGETCVFFLSHDMDEKGNEQKGNYESVFGLKSKDVLLIQELLNDASTIILFSFKQNINRADTTVQKVIKSREFSCLGFPKSLNIFIDEKPGNSHFYYAGFIWHDIGRILNHITRYSTSGDIKWQKIPDNSTGHEQQGWVLTPQQVAMLDRVSPVLTTLPGEGNNNPLYWLQTSSTRGGTVVPDGPGVGRLFQTAQPPKQK